MASDSNSWALRWARQVQSHADCMTLLQLAINSLQAALYGQVDTSLWLLRVSTGEWLPVVSAAQSNKCTLPSQTPLAELDNYTQSLREHAKLGATQGDCLRALYPGLAEAELLGITHWLVSDDGENIVILEFESGGAVVAKQQALIDSCMPLFKSLILAPVFSVNELQSAAFNQPQTYAKLVEQERLISMGRLVASVTHEVNSPLGVAVTGVSHFKEALADLNNHFNNGTLSEPLFRNFMEESEETAELLSFNLARAVKLIGDFKASAVSQKADTATRFALQDVLNSTINSLRPELKRHDIVFNTHQIPEVTMQSFPGALSQIITNLVFNSINHAFDGIEEKQVSLECTLTEVPDQLIMIYRDNGQGIAEKNVASVFEPYFTTRRESGGSGLGLAIVKTLATSKLKGAVNLKTAPGEGVEFTFTLPVSIE